MKRRDLFRRSIAGLVGAATALVTRHASASEEAAPREFPAGYDASADLARADWQPRFLNDHQNQTLFILGDMIIPETDTPGATGALCNRFIDQLLAAETPQVQKQFLESLAFLDGECRQLHGAAFVHLSETARHEVLTFLAYPHDLVTWQSNRSAYPGHRHFTLLKSWISRAYYNSEAGMKELGWDGSVIHEPFLGCTHSEDSHQ